MRLVAWEMLLTNVVTTTRNRGTFIGENKFISTDKFISKYIHRYLKPMNIFCIHQFELGTDEYMAL
jgi:hypothetical protein